MLPCVRFEVAVYKDEFGIRHDYYRPQKAVDALMPKMEVVEGTPYTLEFLADLIIDRYQMYIPNYRESIRMTADKFNSSDSTCVNWLKKVAQKLKPLLCWEHVRAKFKYAQDYSKDSNATWFIDQKGRLYMVESENVLLQRNPVEIKNADVRKMSVIYLLFAWQGRKDNK